MAKIHRAHSSSAASLSSKRGSRRSAPSSLSTSRPRGMRRMLDRALARGQATLADRRHADRRQGHHRDERHAHGERFAAVRRLAQRSRRRERRGLARGGRVIVGKTVTTEFACDRAARDPQPVGSAPHARRLEQRFGRGVAGARSAWDRHAGDRLDRAAGELLRLRRIQAHGRRDQSRRKLSTALARARTGALAATLEEAWHVAYEISACRRRPWLPRSIRSADVPAAAKPRRACGSGDRGVGGGDLGERKAAFEEALARLRVAGVTIV